MTNFGEIHEIKRVNPGEDASKKFFEEESNDMKINEKNLDELLLLMDDKFEDKNITATDYEVLMTINENIPNLLPICDIRIITSYQNQPAQCFNCYRMGHYSSYCIEKRVDYGIYSLFANKKWGSQDHSKSVENLRLREAVSHKKNIMMEVRKGKELEEIKPRNRAIGQIMQNKINDVMKKNMSKRPLKRFNRSKEDEDKCWNLHSKIARLNQTQPSMLTPKGIKFLKFAKEGLKNETELNSLDFPLKMCELSLAHVESDEEIKANEIALILATWGGFQIEPNRKDLGGSKVPRF